MQKRYLLLPLVVVVVAASTWGLRRLSIDDGQTDDGQTPVALTAEQVRDALRRPAAPLVFREFNAEDERGTASSLVPSCYDRTVTVDGDVGGTNALLNNLTGQAYAPEYQAGDATVRMQLMHIAQTKVDEVHGMVTDPAQCHVEHLSFTQYTVKGWGTVFPLSMGDGAMMIRQAVQDTDEDPPEPALNGEDLVAVSGTWIVFASGSGLTGTTPEIELKALLRVPTLVREALRSFDAAAGTNFATAPSGRPATCTAESLTADSLTGASGNLPTVLGGVHDAACRDDLAWLNQYLTPDFLIDGHAHPSTNAFDVATNRPSLTALAEAIEAGPTGSDNRAVYEAREWTFLFEKRFSGLRAFRGQSSP